MEASNKHTLTPTPSPSMTPSKSESEYIPSDSHDSEVDDSQYSQSNATEKSESEPNSPGDFKPGDHIYVLPRGQTKRVQVIFDKYYVKTIKVKGKEITERIGILARRVNKTLQDSELFPMEGAKKY